MRIADICRLNISSVYCISSDSLNIFNYLKKKKIDKFFSPLVLGIKNAKIWRVSI